MKALALILLLVPTLAFAQSDTRKVAIWTYNKTTNSAGSAPAPNAGGASDEAATDSYHCTITALDRMGVPYTQFNLADSAGGWRSTIGAARPGGMADSTWFRQNGYMLHIFPLGDISTSSTLLPIRVFTDGRATGGYVQSPLRGEWGVPALILSAYTDNSAGTPFFNGAATIFTVGVPQTWQSYFANGDTVSSSQDGAANFRYQPAFSDSISEVYISSGDSTRDNGGSCMRAWRWKTGAYYFPGGDGTAAAQWTLLGLAQVFRDLGYVPRRKLNLHMTLDHLYAQTGADGYTTPTDSALVYLNAANWRPAIAFKSHRSEYDLTYDPIRTKMNAWVNSKRLPVTPHSHVVRVGNWGQGTSWNMTAWSDTNLTRERWNFMESFIADTLRLPLASGYERTAGMPGDWVSYRQIYILAQNRYAAVRSSDSDSIGFRPNVSLWANQAIFAGPVAGLRYKHRPWKWSDPASGRSIWIHSANSYPTADDTLWANQPGLSGNFTIHSYTFNQMTNLASAILWDTDFYWHPNEGLETSAATTNLPMNVYLRRMTYFMNRISNICDVQPFYRPKNPRKSSIPR